MEKLREIEKKYENTYQKSIMIENFRKNYDKKSEKLKKKYLELEKELQKNKKYDPYTDGIDSINYLFYMTEKLGKSFLSKEEENVNKKLKALTSQLRAKNLETEILNKLTNNNYSSIKEAIWSKKNILKEKIENRNSLGLAEWKKNFQLKKFLKYFRFPENVSFFYSFFFLFLFKTL